MATQITNQATLTYQYGSTTGTASSNIATVILRGPLSMVKTSLDATYRAGQDITYIVTMTNSGTCALTDVTVTDTLGTYTIAGGGTSVMPLTFIAPALLYVNGAPAGSVTPVVGNRNIQFTIPSLAPGANAMILYKTSVNEYAPLFQGASITNTISITACGLAEPLQDSHTIIAEGYADVSILKHMSPDPVTGGGVLTYTFSLQNYGNMEAANVVLRDAFRPAPSNLTVSINGATIPSGDYSYSNGVLTLPAQGAATSLAIPSAVFTQDPVTGVVSVSPGTATVTVSGTV